MHDLPAAKTWLADGQEPRREPPASPVGCPTRDLLVWRVTCGDRARRSTGTAGEGAGNTRLSLLLAAAMFVLVVDTSLMNVSISAVVKDLDTTVSGVQSAIALEALVSAAFILISSKVGDLIGRKRAYVLGLLGYAIGALAMTLAQSLDGDHHLLGDHRRPRARRCCCRRCSR